jgi:outer membrane protein assembly factor BamB
MRPEIKIPMINWWEKTMFRNQLSGIVTFLALMAMAVVSADLRAQDWPNWRGPNYNGSTEAKGLPTKFSKTENVKWAADMPGHSSGTPVIIGDKVFVSSLDEKAQKLVGICLDRKTGKVLWTKNAGSGYQPKGEGTKTTLRNRSNYSSPSPVTDGKRVVFFYGNGDLSAYDMDGKKLWAMNIQEKHGVFGFQWTFGSSPALFENKVIVQVLQRDTAVHGIGGGKSYVLALDAASGKELWKHTRETDAKKESRESFSTPIPYEQNGRKEIIVKGGDILTGHDPENGKELWRWGTWNPGHRESWWRVVPSPVIGNGVVLACGPKNAAVFAVKLGQSGDISKAGQAWVADKRLVTSDVPTPLFYKGQFYILSDKKNNISRVDPKSGEIKWTKNLPKAREWRSSPSGGDGKIYIINHDGTLVIMNPEDGKIINTIKMGDNDKAIRASIAIAHSNLFIRTGNKLYCIGK